MRPKFEVGEVVILQSKGQPESNGEYVIGKILQFEESTPCRLNPRYMLVCDGLIGYLFTEPVTDLQDDCGTEAIWAEASLRKKHQPGELSFTDLMASLSSPKLITHQA